MEPEDGTAVETLNDNEVDLSALNGPVETPSSSDNPSWGAILETLPDYLHPTVKPELEKWDRGVQQRFDLVQSQYAPFKPFIDSKVDPAQIEGSLQLFALMENDPRRVYEALQQEYGEQWGISGQGPSDDSDDEYEEEDPYAGIDIENHPMFQQLKQNQDTVAGFLAAQVEKEERAKVDQQIDTEFKNATEKHGELTPQDVEMITSIALSRNVSIEEAADKVFEYRGATPASVQNTAPRVIAPGGGIASQPLDPTALDSRGTRELVANIIAANANKG